MRRIRIGILLTLFLILLIMFPIFKKLFSNYIDDMCGRNFNHTGAKWKPYGTEAEIIIPGYNEKRIFYWTGIAGPGDFVPIVTLVNNKKVRTDIVFESNSLSKKLPLSVYNASDKSISYLIFEQQEIDFPFKGIIDLDSGMEIQNNVFPNEIEKKLIGYIKSRSDVNLKRIKPGWIFINS
jgi:hypothetical protein